MFLTTFREEKMESKIHMPAVAFYKALLDNATKKRYMRLRRKIGDLYQNYQSNENFITLNNEINQIVEEMLCDIHYRTKTKIMKDFLVSVNKALAKEQLSNHDFLEYITNIYLSFLEEEY